jgi:hypothetical protein
MYVIINHYITKCDVSDFFCPATNQISMQQKENKTNFVELSRVLLNALVKRNLYYGKY